MSEIIKSHMTLAFSRRLALLFSILVPLAELVRRSQQLDSMAVLPHLVDDFLIGGALLYAAMRCSRDPDSGRRYLAAAWGAACGMGYYSFAGQLMTLSQPDPASPASRAVSWRKSRTKKSPLRERAKSNLLEENRGDRNHDAASQHIRLLYLHDERHN
jgi:hypothetical protein